MRQRECPDRLRRQEQLPRYLVAGAVRGQGSVGWTWLARRRHALTCAHQHPCCLQQGVRHKRKRAKAPRGQKNTARSCCATYRKRTARSARDEEYGRPAVRVDQGPGDRIGADRAHAEAGSEQPPEPRAQLLRYIFRRNGLQGGQARRLADPHGHTRAQKRPDTHGCS